jgi:hypothetical protein
LGPKKDKWKIKVAHGQNLQDPRDSAVSATPEIISVLAFPPGQTSKKYLNTEWILKTLQAPEGGTAPSRGHSQRTADFSAQY